jgi:hypothetical protein
MPWKIPAAATETLFTQSAVTGTVRQARVVRVTVR